MCRNKNKSRTYRQRCCMSTDHHPFDEEQNIKKVYYIFFFYEYQKQYSQRIRKQLYTPIRYEFEYAYQQIHINISNVCVNKIT